MLISSYHLFGTAFCALRLFSTRTAPFVSLAMDNWKNASSIYDFTAKDINGKDVPLEKYRGHVAIIVNVASECGFTAANYKELVELHEAYAESKGLRIMAFPCNQFGGQVEYQAVIMELQSSQFLLEPGNAEEIMCFAKTKKVEFDMFEKIDVNGENAHPLWKYLKQKQGGTLGEFIKWNFTKFIIDKNGQPIERHGPSTNPKDLISSLEKYW